MILNREGIRRKDDMLPRRILEEAVPSGPIAGRVLTEEMYNRLLDDYYRERGWTNDGVPEEETIERLGIQELL
jgi:aldehyde:ferredoxin oxidoreductase